MENTQYKRSTLLFLIVSPRGRYYHSVPTSSPMVPDSCAHHPPPAYLSFLTAAISIFLTIVTIPGNFLVCVAIVRDPFRELRTPFSFLLLSLAVTDLLVGAVMDPISAVYHLSEGLQLALVDIWILHIVYFILCTASILTLAALTVDRYYAVMKPLRYKTRLTRRRALFSAAVIWTLAIASSMFYFKLGFILYSFIFANTSVICTTAVLFFVYSRLYQRLRKRLTVWKTTQMPQTSAQQERQRKRQFKTAMADTRATKAFVLVLMAFLTCFAPACAMIYVLNFCGGCSCLVVNWLRDLQFIIVLVNSGINPYIYAWRLPQFKKALGKLFPSQRGRAGLGLRRNRGHSRADQSPTHSRSNHTDPKDRAWIEARL